MSLRVRQPASKWYQRECARHGRQFLTRCQALGTHFGYGAEYCSKCDRACHYCLRAGHAPAPHTRRVAMSRTRPARIQPLDSDDDAT